MLFIVTSFNYGDRATLSIAGSGNGQGYWPGRGGWATFFRDSPWATLSVRSPADGLLDRFGFQNGSIFWSIFFIWSMFALLQEASSISLAASVLSRCLPCDFWSGWRKAPSFASNSRIVAAWFPAQERGTCSGDIQLRAILCHRDLRAHHGLVNPEVGWSHVFFFMGGLGIVISFVWLKVIHEPNQHPGVNKRAGVYCRRRR